MSIWHAIKLRLFASRSERLHAQRSAELSPSAKWHAPYHPQATAAPTNVVYGRGIQGLPGQQHMSSRSGLRGVDIELIQ